MVYLHCPPPRPIPIKMAIGLKSSRCTEQDTNTESNWILYPFYRSSISGSVSVTVSLTLHKGKFTLTETETDVDAKSDVNGFQIHFIGPGLCQCEHTLSSQITLENLTWYKAENERVTNGRINEPEENDSPDYCPHRVHCALLKPLCYHLIQTVTHTAQLRRKPVKLNTRNIE